MNIYAATSGDVDNLAIVARRTITTQGTLPPRHNEAVAVGALRVLRRLLDVETELAATRAAIAAHAAAADAGDDPTAADLLTDLDRAGHPLTADDLDTARTLHTATAVAW